MFTTNLFVFLKSVFHWQSMSSSTAKASDASPGLSRSSPFLPLPQSRHLEIKEYMRILKIAVESKPEAQDQLARHTVVRLEHMKDIDGRAQHEYVVASVIDHNGAPVRLLIERCKGQGTAPNGETHKKHPKNSSTLTLASSAPNSSQDSILKATPAMDVVQNIGDKKIPKFHVRSLFVPHPTPFPLLRLAIIIEAVHDQNSLYTVLRSQCYWFAMLVMGVAMTQGGKVTIFPEKPSRTTAAAAFEEKFLQPLELSEPGVNPTEIPIPSPPPDEELTYETVRDLVPSVGKHNGIPIVEVHSKEIHIVALESHRRYEAVLNMQNEIRSQREAQSEELKRQIFREAWEQTQRETEAQKQKIADLERQLLATQQRQND